MFIKVRLHDNDKDFWIRADQVRSVETSTQGSYVCQIGTFIMLPQSPGRFLAYDVRHKQDDVARGLAEAMKGPGAPPVEIPIALVGEEPSSKKRVIS